jgi:hypothetical protein
MFSLDGADYMSNLAECPHCSTRVLPMAGRVCPACRRNLDSPPEPGPSPEQEAEAVYGFAAEQMQYGVAPSGIARSLTDRGLDSEAATAVVRQLEQSKSEANKRAGEKNMLFGALWCIGGIAFTALTYRAAANPGGGRFVVAWGAILFGGIQFVRGLIQSSAGR